MKDFVDDLYRRASEDPDIPFNEQAWDQMEQKLAYAERKRRRGLFWLFFLLFVSVGAGLLWGAQQVGVPQQDKKEKYQGPVAGKTPQQKEKQKQKEKQQQQQQTITEPDQNQESIANSIPNEDKKTQGNANHTINHSSYPGAKSPRLFTSQQGPHPSLNTPSEESLVETPNDQNTRNHGEDSAVFSTQNGENNLADSVKADRALFLAINNLPAALALAETNVEPNPAIKLPFCGVSNMFKETKPIAKAKSWGLGLSAGPDLASVNANGSSAYGFNAGLAFDYRIGKRWVFQASGQYLLKNYVADKQEYFAPSGFWPTHSYPATTEGTCDMLQWSVDLRYNWIAKPKWSSFITLGSSSWTILNEKYDFYYPKYYPGLITHWESGQDKNYWFSLAQASIGFEKNIRPGLSLQVNWFAQMPFQGVGNGKVEIYSSGLGLMVRKQMGKLNNKITTN